MKAFLDIEKYFKAELKNKSLQKKTPTVKNTPYYLYSLLYYTCYCLHIFGLRVIMTSGSRN